MAHLSRSSLPQVLVPGDGDGHYGGGALMRRWPLLLAVAGVLVAACGNEGVPDATPSVSATVEVSGFDEPPVSFATVENTTDPRPVAVPTVDVSALGTPRVASAPADTPPMTIEGASPAGPAVSIDGTISGGSAVIGIPTDLRDPSVTAAYLDETTGEWRLAGGVLDRSTGLIYVETEHLSIWQAISLPGWEMVSDLRDVLVDLTGLGEQGDAPTCEGDPVVSEVSAVTSGTRGAPTDAVFRLDVCATREPGGGYRVKLVNRRPVAIRIKTDGTDATVVDIQLPNAGDLVGLGIDKLGRLLGQPAFGGMLLSAGNSMELIVPGPTTFFGEVDNAGTAWTVILQAASRHGAAGWDAVATLSDGWDFTAASSGDWKDIVGEALEQLWGELLDKSGKSRLASVASVFSSSLVVAVRGTFDGGFAPWFGNVGVRIDVYEEPGEDPPAAGLTSCEGTDMGLFEPGVVNVVCVYPWALAESTAMIGSGPAVIVSLATTNPRAFVTSWWEVEQGPGLSGYTVEALIGAGVDPAAAQALFDALDACNGCF